VAFETFVGLALLVAAVASALLPRGRRWLVVVGVLAAIALGVFAWLGTEYSDEEWESAWMWLPIIAIPLAAVWIVGVGLGYAVRQALSVRQTPRS
jgi:TRAP-type C4-dicarboxylate transport system permease small subunit